VFNGRAQVNDQGAVGLPVDFELLDLLVFLQCKENDYTLNEEAKNKFKQALIDQVAAKDEHFANGRLVRNIYDDLVMNHAKRVVKIENPNYETLSVITDEDFE